MVGRLVSEDKAVTRPFRFGACAGDGGTAAEWTELARGAEDLGYHSLQMPDHFGRQFAIGPALGVVAAVTTTLRIGCTVYVNDFHHPTLLAREVATLDVLSQGRMECGLGAGWKRSEYLAVGARFDEPRVRVDRLSEAVTVLKKLWTEPETNHTGAHYRISGYSAWPKPVQSPYPPLMIGGGGRRMLELAAREADVVSLVQPAHADGSLDFDSDPEAALERRAQAVEKAAADRGRQLSKHILVWRADVRPSQRPSDSPYELTGSVSAVVDRLQEMRERWGLSYFSIPEGDLTAFAPVVDRLSGR